MNPPSRGPASATGDVSIAVVIPTHNRADLAIAACRSLLGQPGRRHQVFVSDNSTRAEEIQKLTDFCRATGDPRLVYLQPAASLPMPTHWDWALEQAMERSDATHFYLHYDRKITKPGQVDLLLKTVRQFPEHLLTHCADHVADEPRPSTLWQYPWSGKTYELRTSRVVALTVRCQINEMGQAFPILSNCVVPRPVFTAIRERFGNVCDSTGPDSCFTYRFCALNERYVHFDCPTGIIYAWQRSNGLGYVRNAGGDFPAFLEAWGSRPWQDAAPIPELNLGQNLLFHEYEIVRRAVGSDAFPPIEMDAYLHHLVASLYWVRDGEREAQLLSFLEQHGWRPRPGAAAVPGEHPLNPAARRRPWVKRMLAFRAARWCVLRARAGYRALQHRPEVVQLLSNYLRIRPYVNGLAFRDDQHAVRFALKVPLRQAPENAMLDPLQPVELSAGP